MEQEEYNKLTAQLNHIDEVVTLTGIKKGTIYQLTSTREIPNQE